ncbi:MAG: hypothetical protein CHACPFDD_02709 [Phycisphaerae bacterium]|nr:hypothetical protein [Phycisphaerae bacterium]
MLASWYIVDILARNWAIVVIAFTITTLVVVPVLVIRKYALISLNILRNTAPPLARTPLDYEPVRGEPITFPAFDGLSLAGMLLRPEPHVPRRGTIIFAHEFCADMHSCARYARPLLDVGYEILTFDFRGHGQSSTQTGFVPRQWVTERELYDIRGATALAKLWLTQRGLPPLVGIFGISRGAGAAILAAEEDLDVRAIVADGAYSTDVAIEYFMRRWAYIFASVRVLYENHHPAFWRFLRWTVTCLARREFGCRFPSVRRAIQSMIPRPILFIHGERDSYIPVEQTRQLYALAGEPRSLWIAPGARHNQAVTLHPAQYARRTTAFFDRHLAARPTQPAPITRDAPTAGAALVAAPRAPA